MLARRDKHAAIPVSYLVDTENGQRALGAYVLVKLLEVRQRLVVRFMQPAFCLSRTIVAKESQFVNRLERGRGDFENSTNGHLNMLSVVLVQLIVLMPLLGRKR
jgi:hypothetical protein